VAAINGLAHDLCRAVGSHSGCIVDAVICGNTAMHHLLLGLPVRQLGRAPFVAALHAPTDVKARDLGLNFCPGARVHLAPNVGGFVGGDHVTALLATEERWRAPGTSLVMDIGTNTEISLIHGGEISSASCPSGPALEGGHISCGMRAADGAIERVGVVDGRLVVHTIGQRDPVGLCGSGVLDALAALRRLDIVSARGRIVAAHPDVEEIDGLRAALLAPGVRLTQHDVRAVQLAKAAIRTGVELLLRDHGIGEQQIDRFIIAGAFGAYIDVASGIDIGLFPDLPASATPRSATPPASAPGACWPASRPGPAPRRSPAPAATSNYPPAASSRKPSCTTSAFPPSYPGDPSDGSKRLRPAHHRRAHQPRLQEHPGPVRHRGHPRHPGAGGEAGRSRRRLPERQYRRPRHDRSRVHGTKIITAIQEVVGTPLSFDFPSRKVQEICLAAYRPERAGGALPIVNSITEHRWDLMELYGKYRFKVILMASERIEDGVARGNKTAEQIHGTARRAALRLKSEYGMALDDIFIDMSVSAIIADTEGLNRATVDAIRMIGADPELKGVHMMGGLSNIGQQLPPKAADGSDLKHCLENAFLTLTVPHGFDTVLGTPWRGYAPLPEETPRHAGLPQLPRAKRQQRLARGAQVLQGLSHEQRQPGPGGGRMVRWRDAP
jgi:hypothetical protein